MPDDGNVSNNGELIEQRLNEMTTTIHDVARIAGVGTGTVSRVINNSPGVKPATRKKVLSAIAQLNYRPNPIARSMISKRTGAIGVIVPFFTRPFNTELLRAVQAALSRSGKELVLYDVETAARLAAGKHLLEEYLRMPLIVKAAAKPEKVVALTPRQVPEFSVIASD